MKRIKTMAIALVAMLILAAPAQAQFRWGIKAGADFNKLSFKETKEFTDPSNRTGFTGGIMTEIGIPVIGICFDASLMYTHKSLGENVGNDYLSIPINLKYKIGLPIVGNLLTPYIFTGPDFAFLLSKKSVEDVIKNKTADISWNLGAGVQLFNHLQIGASYGWGINKCASIITGLNGQKITARNNTWTVTAAYLF